MRHANIKSLWNYTVTFLRQCMVSTYAHLHLQRIEENVFTKPRKYLIWKQSSLAFDDLFFKLIASLS